MGDFRVNFSFRRFFVVLLVVVLMSFALNMLGVWLDTAPFNCCVFVLGAVVAIIGDVVGGGSRSVVVVW